MQTSTMDTQRKALQINLDHTKYGAFAEIGAGQEVARWFFRVGGAAGTIAKSISAYDMTVSDAIYGASGRYVSRQRLEKMLSHEYVTMTEHLAGKRGENTQFFVFADTVAAKSYTRKDNCHGWMGIRFQHRPGSEPSQILLHVSLLDRENVSQQEATGILGVNLIHSALYESDAAALIPKLLDDLSAERIEVDLVEFSGPAFEDVDNRLISLELVQRGLSSATMFTPRGEVVQPAEAFHKRAILLLRGHFRPVTNVTVDMLHRALTQFEKQPGNQEEEVLVVTEMTLRNLSEGDEIDHQDFLDRVHILRTLGHPVLISNFGEFYRVANYLQRHTQKLIGLVMGVPTLREIFDEKYYTHLDGGILESFGRLFKNDLKLYVYPSRDPETAEIVTPETLRVARNLQPLRDFLIDNQHIQTIRDFNPDYLSIDSRKIRRWMREGDPSWIHEVPPGVALLICRNLLLGYNPNNSEAKLVSPPPA
jgi:hypothetical protein